MGDQTCRVFLAQPLDLAQAQAKGKAVHRRFQCAIPIAEIDVDGPDLHAMLDGGVYLPPSAFEAWFTSAAHDDAALARIAAALPAAARAAAAALPD